MNLICGHNWELQCGFGRVATASPGSWLQLQIPGFHLRPADSDTQCGGSVSVSSPWGATAQSSGREPLAHPLLSAVKRVSAQICCMRGTQRSQVIMLSLKPLISISFRSVHLVLPIRQAWCLVLGVTPWSLQSGKGRETVTKRQNWNKSKVHGVKSAWLKWEAPGRSSLKDVILAEN